MRAHDLDGARLARDLPVLDAAAVELARRDARARPIDYVLGSGGSDEVALHAGLKPLVRQIVGADRAPAARARFEALGLSVGEAEHRVDRASTAGTVLFAGRDPRRVAEAVMLEAIPEHDRELGRLLGYPACCVDTYVALGGDRPNLAALERARSATRGPGYARLNTLDLAVFHYVSWLPCSLDCAISRAYADRVASHLADRHGQPPGRGRAPATRCPPGCRHETFVREIDRALGAHRLVAGEDVQISIEGTTDGRALRVARAWPTARDRHPDVPLDGPALEAVARLCTLVRAAERVEVEGGTLALDGRPIARGPNVGLYLFG